MKWLDQWLHLFISWARYLYWSELNRQRLDQCIKNPDPSTSAIDWEWWAFMSQWYASLWVVVEGWKNLKTKDDEIEFLIARHPQFCQLLKKFRHGVYHCRPTLLDEESLAFVKQGQAAAYWAAALHEEFQRFYYEWPEKVAVTKKQVNDLRNILYEIVGWLPTEIMPARKHDLEKICSETETILEEASDFTSPAALKVLKAIEQARNTIKQSPERIFLPKFKKLKE